MEYVYYINELFNCNQISHLYAPLMCKQEYAWYTDPYHAVGQERKKGRKWSNI